MGDSEIVKDVDYIEMNLSGYKMKLTKNGLWKMESEDLNQSLFEIARLVEEKEQLGKSLELALQQIDLLTTEVTDLNKTKKVVLEMVSCSNICNVQILSNFSPAYE
jgi:cell shape-determining protein MreC